ncbi:MAG: DUF359 domain-containing protein [Methanomicrobiales archaeon]|nr:DUF359 domain-containing protein [Methanomicrobiales archaeon]NYT21189.1 DUF359 domain-containing protein [Methanomicrobiales archaeon]
MLKLPPEKRHFFKAPFGTLYADCKDVLPLLEGKTVYTVGDVVTCHLVRQGVIPGMAIIDGHTMRSPFNRSPIVFKKRLHARNPAGTLTRELLEALDQAVQEPGVLILVDGEEDLAVIPLVIAAPFGALILYGQPGEGVVLCEVTPAAKEKARRMLAHFVETGEEQDE